MRRKSTIWTAITIVVLLWT